MAFTGKIVSSLSYNLMSRIERRNAQKDLKAYLKGKPMFRETVWDDSKQKYVKNLKVVSRNAE